MYSSLNEKNGTPWGGAVSDVNILPLMFSAGSKKTSLTFQLNGMLFNQHQNFSMSFCHFGIRVKLFSDA